MRPWVQYTCENSPLRYASRLPMFSAIRHLFYTHIHVSLCNIPDTFRPRNVRMRTEAAQWGPRHPLHQNFLQLQVVLALLPYIAGRCSEQPRLLFLVSAPFSCDVSPAFGVLRPVTCWIILS